MQKKVRRIVLLRALFAIATGCAPPSTVSSNRQPGGISASQGEDLPILLLNYQVSVVFARRGVNIL